MATFKIQPNNSFYTEITVNQSDKYSKLIYLKLERNYIDEGQRGINEMFITPEDLKALGEFFVKESQKISAEQEIANRVEVNRLREEKGLKGYIG